MKNKFSKSLVVTGLATAGFAAVAPNQVHAESQTGTEKETTKSADASVASSQGSAQVSANSKEAPVDEQLGQSLLSAAKEQAENSAQSLETQNASVATASADVQAAQSQVEAAQAEVEVKEQNVKDATPENIKAAEATVSQAQDVVSNKEEAVKTAQESEEIAKQAVEKQETEVAAKQTLVDMAQHELDQASEVIKPEKDALATAKAAVETAVANQAQSEQKLQEVNRSLGDRSQEISDAEKKVNDAEAVLAQTNAAIAQKETELQNAPASPSVAGTYSYSNFLDYLQAQVTDSAYAGLAAQAKAQYDKFGTVTTENSGSYENALAAVRILREVNKARKAAGLHELYINPFTTYESQIQLEASRSRIAANQYPHTNIFNANENLAWGGSPEWAVGYWQNEKAAYQALAAQYGLPTDETQLDANAIYMKTSANAFSGIGHYVQDMGNQFTVATAAFVNDGNVSQISFRSQGNLQALLAAGVLMTVDQYEAKLQEFASALQSGSLNSRATKVQAELDALKAQKTSAVVSLNLAKESLAQARGRKVSSQEEIAQAQQELLQAGAALQVANQNLSIRQANYNAAVEKHATILAPKQGQLKQTEANLAEAKVTLARLEQAYSGAHTETEEAQKELATAKEAVLKAEQILSDLKNAPQNLVEAKAKLAQAQAEYQKAKVAYEQALMKQEVLRSVYDKLQATYLQLEAKYGHSAAAGVGSPELIYNNESLDSSVQPKLLAKAGTQTLETYQATAKKGNTSVVNRTKSTGTLLPSTGSNQSEAEFVASMGLLLGAATLAVSQRKKKEETK